MKVIKHNLCCKYLRRLTSGWESICALDNVPQSTPLLSPSCKMHSAVCSSHWVEVWSVDFSTPTTNFFVHVSFLPLVCSINTVFMFSFAASTALSPLTTLVWKCKTIIGACCHCCCTHYVPFTMLMQIFLSSLCCNNDQLSAWNNIWEPFSWSWDC